MLACGLTSAGFFHTLLLLPATCHTSPAPLTPCFVLHFPEEVVYVVGCRGAAKGDPDLVCGIMELVVQPLPAPSGLSDPFHIRAYCVISCLCFALQVSFLEINKSEQSGDDISTNISKVSLN